MRNDHIVQLDGLRFFAVLMVMIAHWLQWQWSNPLLVNMPFVNGVTLFFVLSGFLISRILFVNRDECIAEKISKFHLIKSFYLRRFFRIFPIYYLLIIALFFFNYKNTQEIFPWLVTYTSNWYQSINNVYLGEYSHFWSLAVEEQFYLFWPFCILFVKPSKSINLILIFILIAIAVRVYLFVFVGKWMATAYSTFSCMDSLGIGALLAYINLYKKDLFKKIARISNLYILGGFYITGLFVQDYFHLYWYKEIFGVFVFSLVAGIVIAISSQNGFKSWAKYILELKFISYSGRISYGMYVYHVFVATLFFYFMNRFDLSLNNKYLMFVFLYFITFYISHLSWKYIESPINNLKKKVPYLPKRTSN